MPRINSHQNNAGVPNRIDQLIYEWKIPAMVRYHFCGGRLISLRYVTAD